MDCVAHGNQFRQSDGDSESMKRAGTKHKPSCSSDLNLNDMKSALNLCVELCIVSSGRVTMILL